MCRLTLSGIPTCGQVLCDSQTSLESGTPSRRMLKDEKSQKV
jgi:hypothetical protein